MKKYIVKLVNCNGCMFQSRPFNNIKTAKSWATGHGKTLENDIWKKYTVLITKNGEEYMQYQTC